MNQDIKALNPGDDVTITACGAPAKIIAVHFSAHQHIIYSIVFWNGPNRIIQAVEPFEIRPAGLQKGD